MKKYQMKETVTVKYLFNGLEVKDVWFYPPFKNVNSFNCPDILSETAPQPEAMSSKSCFKK